MNESASEAETLDCSGRKSADLTIERFGEFETSRKLSDAITGSGGGKMIEPAEEEQIFAAGEASVKAEVAAGVIAEIAPDIARGLDGVMTDDAGASGRRQKKRGEDAKESGFARTVGAEKCDGFAFANGKGNVLQRRNGRALERLKKGAPTAASGREKLDEGFDGNREIGHGEVITRPEKRNNLGDLVLEESAVVGREVAG